MTALVWMLSWLPLVLPAMSELPMPVNVTLTPSHFSHILKWEPGPGTPTGAYYLVRITTERGTWMPVAGCERVQQPLVCNLTEAFSDPLKSYMTMVNAHNSSQSAIISEYKPIMHLGLPLLTVRNCGRHLCVALQPPKEHLRQAFDSLSYQLKIRSNDGKGFQFVKDTKSLKGENLTELAPGRQYCVSVRFSDELEAKNSNFSQPVCAFTPGIFPADPLISVFLCLLVIAVVIVVALLAGTGYICLKRRPLPTALASIHHMENVLVVTTLSTPLTSFLKIWPTVPSPGEKRSRLSLSDESDEESATEITGGSTGGCYNVRPGASLLSSSSSSSSLSPKPEPPPGLSSEQPLDFFNSQPTDTHSSAGLKPSLITGTDSLTGEESKADETEHKAVEQGDSQDVNLLTLTFGRQEENKEEEGKSYRCMTKVEQECHSSSEDCSSTEVSQTSGSKEIATKRVSWCVDEEEEEDMVKYSGYMGRTCADV
ncbi:cytokine receptor family member b2 [Acanthochromis polyacanthus]|uniref:Interferon alpha/beta receptor 2-like n=1 Tax=Acanthochromis polyacanthus TaxID=80966 RepID=A0A3Q1FF60_9TELE|nr:cytokine receptor family member b2 [Acanthochromis polyacanthus]